MAGEAAAAEKTPETSTPSDGGSGAPPAKGAPPTKPEGGATVAPPASGGTTKTEDAAEQLGVYEKDGKKFINMPFDSFKERVGKSTKKLLKEIFGTSDKDAIVAIKKKFDDFEKDAETRKKAEMTERQRLETERDAALSAKQVAERRAERARNKVVIQKTEQKVTRIAREHVHADKVDMAMDLFRAKLVGMSREKADKLLGKESEWFKELVSKNPDFAKAGTSATEKTETEPEKKLANNGIDPKKTHRPNPNPPKNSTGKNVKDMSKSELAQYAKENGLNIPSVTG
jgi:hypothetical protein